jgi:hypothetical protein
MMAKFENFTIDDIWGPANGSMYLDEEKERVYTSRTHEKNCAYIPWDYAGARAL